MGHYLVVGGSRGIGRDLAERMAAAGHELTVLCRQPEDLPPAWSAHRWDATDADAAPPAVDGPLDGLAYCPGSITLLPFHRTKDQDFLDDFGVNVLGAARALRAYRDALRASGHASVVLFSTVAVGTGMANHGSIAAAKGAVEGLARSLAAEWAPSVRVNAVAPSLTATPLADRLLRNDKMAAAAAARHPLERIGQPGDAAALAAFLLGPDSGWISGQTLAVDGGMGALRRL